jgi:AraC-like DNA-binding protein
VAPASPAVAGGHPWTVPELASLSGLSRPAFARNFERSLGQAPMQYLTDWRMTLARNYLRTGELTLAQIANRTGYASPNAFAAASADITDSLQASGRASWPDRLSPFMAGEARRWTAVSS